MQKYKTERQRQRDNVEKELMTNYYLQKYNSIMSKISKQPQNKQIVELNVKPKQPEVKSQRMNFKNMILMKKNQNQNAIRRTPKIVNQQLQLKNAQNLQIVHRYSSRDQQQNQKTIKKLEQSIINQLYRTSPSKIEQGKYTKLEISNSYNKRYESTNKKSELEPVPQENIEVTHEQERQVNQFFEDEEEKQRVEKIKQGIRLEFDRRKDHSYSPVKNSRKSSNPKSSRISAEVKIQSPKKTSKSPTPSKYKRSKQSKNQENSSKHENNKQSDSQYPSENQDFSRRQRFQSISSQKKSHQVYFSQDIREELVGEYHESPDYEQVKEQQLQFVPPTSNYYKTQNQNLVEESFKYQEQIRQNKDRDSQKAHSVASSRKSSKQKKLAKNDSKKSIRSRKKSQLKDNSRMQMSFVSKMSMLSSNQCLLIKQKIERQLYDNELGPYQSSLFNIAELIDHFPKSASIYAVGQKTLDDRRAFQQRRIHQESEMAQLKRNIQKIKRKSQIRASSRQQQQIQNNQLEILRLIRKISTTL